MPGAVPHIRRPGARRDHIPRPVEDVERHAAGRAAVEPVGARHAAAPATRDDVAVGARAGACAHDGLRGQRRHRERRAVGQPDERRAAEPQSAARRARDPRGIRGVGRAGRAQRALEPLRPVVGDHLAAGLVEPPLTQQPRPCAGRRRRRRHRERAPRGDAHRPSRDRPHASLPSSRLRRHAVHVRPGTSTRGARPGWAGSTFGQGEPVSDRTQPARPRYATGSSRGFGRSSRPTFAHGRPSTTTTSAVKSFAPRISEEPTP